MDKFFKRNKNTKNINTDNALDYLLEKEFEKFKENMMKKSKEEIFDSAYEITVKKEIKDELKYMNLHRAEKEMLTLQDDILNEFYYDWLNEDTPLVDSMKPCIEESVSTLTKYIGQRFNLSRNNENER